MSARDLVRRAVVIVGMLLIGASVAGAEEPLKLDLGLFAHAGMLEAPSEEERFMLDLQERFIWDAQYAETLRLAFWDSPLGRAEYEMTMAQRDLGVNGLVGAGNSFPFFARVALRDTMTPQLVLTNGWNESWHEISTDHRVQVGLQTAIAAGAIWALVEGLAD